jgi:heat shock protein HtpX
VRSHVKFIRSVFVVLRSWIAFIMAMALIGAFWYLCYWLVDRYADKNIIYFKIGAWTAGILGLIMLVFNELIVVLTMRCRRVRSRNDCPELWDAVQAVTPWYAHPVPRIYIDDSNGMNAFAFGWGLPFFSAVCATRGAVERLSQSELEAVMAHEVGHIINKDILVSTAMAISVMMMAYTGWFLLRFGTGGRSSRSSSDSKGKAALAILVVFLVGGLLYIVGRLIGFILQLFVSRQREYAADATSARIIGSPRPLMSALRKIIGSPRIGSTEAGAAFGFLCTADPEPDDLMSTHPEPSNRLSALEALEK